jgi:flagellin
MSLLRINHNIAALNTQRNLNRTTFNLNKTLQKLSSGYRINTAADGPADLIISESLRSQISGIRAAIRNSQEAANYLDIAEGALIEVSNLLSSLRGLAIHAANTGVVSDSQVAADQAEVDNVLRSINRINDVTRFAGERIFQSAASAVRIFHIGEGGGTTDEISMTISMISCGILGAAGGTLATISRTGANGLSTNPRVAISIVEAAVSQIATIRGSIGAFVKNTLHTNINSLEVSLENITATESFIRDANMAEETTEFTRHQILVQSGVSVLSQANVISQSVLQLLQ